MHRKQRGGRDNLERRRRRVVSLASCPRVWNHCRQRIGEGGMRVASWGRILRQRGAVPGRAALRDFTGADGYIGIIQNPLRAIALPDTREISTRALTVLPVEVHSRWQETSRTESS